MRYIVSLRLRYGGERFGRGNAQCGKDRAYINRELIEYCERWSKKEQLAAH